MASKYAIHTRLKRPLTVMITAVSEREFQFKKKVVERLIEETEGKDYTPKLKIRPVSYAEALRCLLGFHGLLVSGAFQSVFGGMDTIALAMRMAQKNIPLKKEYIAKKVIARLREASNQAHRPICILQDLQGPKIRTGDLAVGQMEITHGQLLTLTTKPVPGNSNLCPVDFPELPNAVAPPGTACRS